MDSYSAQGLGIGALFIVFWVVDMFYIMTSVNVVDYPTRIRPSYLTVNYETLENIWRRQC